MDNPVLWMFVAIIVAGKIFNWLVKRQLEQEALEAAQLNGLPDLHCMDCGEEFDQPSGAWRGNGWIELVLYLFWILPGVVYSIWRRSGKPQWQCPSCGSRRTVPYDSAATRAHRRSLGLG